MTTIYTKLAAIQAALKAPKGQYNEFGGYKYRKAEDILEAVKPHLKENGCTLICTDDLILVGDRYYIKASATITSTEDGSSITTTAFAREEEEKKGMDGSQVTGASSSYARKYALNGLLCIDDTADSDTTNVGDSKPEKKTTPTKKTATSAKSAPDPKDIMPGGKTYSLIVKKYAQGVKSKTGEDYRTVWATMVHADDDLLGMFDHDVATFRK
jgi:hypothetical protein